MEGFGGKTASYDPFQRTSVVFAFNIIDISFGFVNGIGKVTSLSLSSESNSSYLTVLSRGHGENLLL